MQEVVALVAAHNRVVAPIAIIRILNIVNQLVDIGLCLDSVGRGEASHTDAQHVGRDVVTRVIVEKAEEIVGGVAVILVVAAIALVGEQLLAALASDAAVVKRAAAKQKQIFELRLVAVVEHLAQQAVAHGIGCARRELVEYLLMVDHSHGHVVAVAVQVGHPLGLLKHRVGGDDEHVGHFHAVQVLIVDCLPVGDRQQRIAWIECHESRSARLEAGSERFHRAQDCAGAVGDIVVGQGIALRRVGIVDVPHSELRSRGMNVDAVVGREVVEHHQRLSACACQY